MADDYRRQGLELERRIFELDAKCSALKAEKQDDDYIQNADAILDKLKSYYRQGGESSSLSKLLQDYTQVQAVLGLELLECLYWRRGALLYMYCHTLHQRKQWIKQNKETFLKCIQEGVRYLMRMLQVRNSVKLNDGVVLHDTATAGFLSEGIFSDTHLLTMMYIGEMCFWAVKYEDYSSEMMDCKDRLQFRDIGTQILNKYVLACEGPLQGQGWNTENAKEILSVLQ
ncbi:RAB7A-interacting MON1-CCZ1 complex subunit 1 isoform X2 [Nerophis ophidion]|uniref:RAB7A-interacting MON1-CCZ1 complex subunit 1 isoform X2 n=1 Tax=Nerophis ophidion TaxID=159077 RepID=UPI002ADF9C25|nr:RAB7A-interacting MON1-CCZ1 complex subunit 1 isoform X2 [Nerophis ophidion]